MSPRTALLLVPLVTAWLFAGCVEDDDDDRCPYESAAPANSCYYCCFAPPGETGSLLGCYSGETVTEDSCRERLLHEKNCPDPVELLFVSGCQCQVDCDDPEWFSGAP